MDSPMKKLKSNPCPEEGGGKTVKNKAKMSDEWQTVPAKKAYVPPSLRNVQPPTPATPPSSAVATSATQYVPPHMRRQLQEAKKDEPPNLNDKAAFPTLGEVKKLGTAWRKTGTELANALIALDKRTEMEKWEAEEAERAKIGWEVLKLHLDAEEQAANIKRVADRLYQREREVDHTYDLMEMGMYVPDVIITPPRFRATDPEAFVMDTPSDSEGESEDHVTARIDDEEYAA